MVDITDALNHISDGVLALNDEWVFQYANARAEALFRKTQSGPLEPLVARGVSPPRAGGRNLIGQTMRNAFPELEGQELLRIVEDVYATGNSFKGEGVAVVFDHTGNRDYREGFFDVTYQPVLDSAGRISGVLSLGIEVTNNPPATASDG